MSAQKAVELGFADGTLYEIGSVEAQSALVRNARAVYAMAHPQWEPPCADWI